MWWYRPDRAGESEKLLAGSKFACPARRWLCDSHTTGGYVAVTPPSDDSRTCRWKPPSGRPSCPVLCRRHTTNGLLSPCCVAGTQPTALLVLAMWQAHNRRPSQSLLCGRHTTDCQLSPCYVTGTQPTPRPSQSLLCGGHTTDCRLSPCCVAGTQPTADLVPAVRQAHSRLPT